MAVDENYVRGLGITSGDPVRIVLYGSKGGALGFFEGFEFTSGDLVYRVPNPDLGSLETREFDLDPNEIKDVILLKELPKWRM
ncbi:MAG: hypothetical protein V3U72_00695 [Candidatus Aenigmarchaeota archaeon]